MSPSERSFFASSGYVVLKALLSTRQVERVNRTVDARLHELAAEPERSSHRYGKYGTDIGQNSTLGWGRPLVDAVLHPRAVGACREILSQPHWQHCHPDCPPDRRATIRLDHDYLNVLDPPAAGAGATTGQHGRNLDGVGTSRLHGTQDNYHVTCLIELRDVEPGRGGFLCLAGSHSAGFAFPDRRIFPDWEVPPYSGANARSVALCAGDAIIFTVSSATSAPCNPLRQAGAHSSAPYPTARISLRSLIFVVCCLVRRRQRTAQCLGVDGLSGGL